MRMHTLGSPEVGSVTEKVTLGSCGGESGSPLSPLSPPVPPGKWVPPVLSLGPRRAPRGGQDVDDYGFDIVESNYIFTKTTTESETLYLSW